MVQKMIIFPLWLSPFSIDETTPVLYYATVRVNEDYSSYVVNTYTELQNTVPVNPSGIIPRLLIFWNSNDSKAAELWVLLLFCAQQPADVTLDSEIFKYLTYFRFVVQ